MYALKTFATTVGLFALALGVWAAGTNPREEAAIRKILAGGTGSLPRTTDAIFWSGASQRPSLGSERAPEITGENAPSNRVPNSTKSRETPVRIVVSDSGDLAYEYSTFTLTFQRKDGTPVNRDGAVLRVWQKEAGQWKCAAEFRRPFGQVVD